MSTALSGKPQRVLACVLCQQRKIKCDRNTPCSHCVKAGVTCVPSTPAPARKRRRPNQDLQQRLARCEELLQEYATAKPPGAATEQPAFGDSSTHTGKLIHDNGGVRFMDSYLWANVHDELRAMKEILVEDDDQEDESSLNTPADGQSPDHLSGLLLSDGACNAINLQDLHPEPAHVFRLWQIFLDRVNPLYKIIHVPTLQPIVAEAAGNHKNLSKKLEALLFSIYTISTVALTEEESIALLGYSKTDAFRRFSTGTRQALMRIGILENYDLVILQSLVLFMTSLFGRYDRHAAWILNGVIVRIAQKMGVHRDGEALGLPPFETEMRRRIWWQIILLDVISAMNSGLRQSVLPQLWDTKEPSNINDNDLFPSMQAVKSREGPTDMVFCLLTCEMAKLMTEPNGLEMVILKNEYGVANGPNGPEVEKGRLRIAELDENMRATLEKYGDPGMGPIHELAFAMRPTITRKLNELICPPREQEEWGGEVRTPQDNFFKIAIFDMEHSLVLYKIAQERGLFLWFVKTHFQIEVFLYIVGQLAKDRTSGQLVERAWKLVEQHYHYHNELYDLSAKTHTAAAVFTLRAWRKRETTMLAAQGRVPDVPDYIPRLQRLLASASTSSTSIKDSASPDTPPINSIPAAPMNQAPLSVEIPWDQMLGFVDLNATDWGVYTPEVPLDQSNFTGFGSGLGGQLGGNVNGWL